MERLDSEFAKFVEELRHDAVARTVQGCSPAEIDHLQQVCGVQLPRVYRLYLLTMGHAADRLFTHDHLAVSYEYVLRLGDQLRKAMIEPAAPGAPAFDLPPNSLVIFGRLSEQFLFIVCNRPDDSPVFHVDSWDRVSKQAYPSILDWLRDMRNEAVEAIRDGYYSEHPNGTIP